MFKLNKAKGNILLFSLLIVSVLIVVALLISNLVISSLVRGKIINDSLQAWYAAEISTENALYQARKNDNFNLNLESSNLAGSVVKRSTVVEPSLEVSILENGNYQLDLFNSDPAAPQIYSLEINALHPGEIDNLSWLAVSWDSWSPGSYDNPEAHQERMLSASQIKNGERIVLASVGEYYYRVRLRALYSDINDLILTVYDDENNQIEDIPSRVVISSQGSHGLSGEKITVTMPRRAPLYDLFGYVIFSEDKIVK